MNSSFRILIIDISLIVIFEILTVLSLSFAVSGSSKVLATIGIKYTYEYLAMPVGFGLSLIYTVPHVLEDIKNIRGVSVKEEGGAE